MIIFPAIDIVAGKAVRLFKGDYNQMTVYNENPASVAVDFKNSGAGHIHIVDLEGAKTGNTPNFETVLRIKEKCGLFCEIGGGIRNIETVRKYLNAGIDRVILGTAAVDDEPFLDQAAYEFGDRIAVGVDIKAGFVAIKGWLENSGIEAFEFCEKMCNKGIGTLICTDISKDGAMKGTNLNLYKTMSMKFDINITASGGVSSIDDVKRLAEMHLYGAIIGKAYYTGAINLAEAIEVAE